uniref:Uncharacterized protein n=1 Tax=Parascaris equorum TaxID=6256 RepID=A0A914RCT5_PAREQ
MHYYKEEAKMNEYNINWSHLFNESLEPVYTVAGSTFTNTTEREQEYSFKTERSTRSTATVVVVMHIGENTTEEELIWGVDSTVRVPPLCETVAELVILEEHHTR